MRANMRVSPVTLLPLSVFLASAWLAGLVFYQELPGRIPTHWSTPLGKPDGFPPSLGEHSYFRS
jgi:hypothetical protein